MQYVLMDFESAQPDLKLLKEGGAWRYWEDICTEVLCLCYSYNGTTFTWTPECREHEAHLRGLAADNEVVFIRHGEFEIAAWRYHMMPVFGFPDKPNNRWHDVMASAACKALPLALEKLATALNMSVRKDMDGRKHTLGLSKPNKRGYYDRSGDAIQRVVEYCMLDVEAEWEVHNTLGFLPKNEWGAFLLNQEMNQRGLRLDLEYIARAQEVVDRATEPLAKRFTEITGLKPTQTVALAKWAGLSNVSKETVANILGEETDEEETETDLAFRESLPGRVSLSAGVREALEIRSLIGSASIKKLKRMAVSVCADGRCRGLSQYHGAGPGRSTGRLWQPYNLPRGSLSHLEPETVVEVIKSGDPDYVACVLGPPIQAVVSSLRHAIIPDDGKVFLSGDYAGIQARVVLALAGQHDKAKLMAEGKDVYCDMASLIYKRSITKADVHERTMGKCAVLGLGFGMGWKRFKALYGKGSSDEFCQEVVRVYRKEWAPNVPELWNELKRASICIVESGQPKYATDRIALDNCARLGIYFENKKDGWLSVILPSGRKLWYHNPRIIRDPRWVVTLPNQEHLEDWEKEKHWYIHEDDIPKEETAFEVTHTYSKKVCYDGATAGQIKEEPLHGAKLAENIVMGIEVDIHRHGMQNCEAKKFPVVFECYDEIVSEVPDDDKADLEAFHKCMLDVPDWVHTLQIPIAVEGWKGYRYRK